MSTNPKQRTGPKAARHAVTTSAGTGGGATLETAEQRANYQHELSQLIESGVAAEQLRRVYRERKQAAHGEMLKRHAELRKEFHEIATSMSERKSIDLSTPEKAKAYHALTLRYGVPSPDDVHIDTLATDLLGDYAQNDFIAPLAMPWYKVGKRSGKLAMLSQRAGKNASFDDARNPGASAKEIDYAVGTPVSYDVQGRGLKLAVPDEVTENEDDPYRVAELSARYVQEVVDLKHEKRVATIIQTASNYLTAHRIAAPGVKWDNADRTDNEHLDDLHAARILIRRAIGKEPNTFVCNLATAHALVRKTDFRDRVKYVQKIHDTTLLSELGAYLSVENVLIGMAVEDTANPASTASFSDIWTDAPALLRVESPSLSFSGFGLCPVTDPGTVMRWRNPDMSAKSDLVAVTRDCDEIVVMNNAGCIFQDVLT